jgi:hypothetical protein
MFELGTVKILLLILSAKIMFKVLYIMLLNLRPLAVW